MKCKALTDQGVEERLAALHHDDALLVPLVVRYRVAHLEVAFKVDQFVLNKKRGHCKNLAVWDGLSEGVLRGEEVANKRSADKHA